jgi:hypothetical protein
VTEHFSLLQTSINYGRKSFIVTLSLGVQKLLLLAIWSEGPKKIFAFNFNN